jgi:predicted branched-subunit amino acid permease
VLRSKVLRVLFRRCLRGSAQMAAREPHWSPAGLVQGVRISLPAMPVMGAFGFAFGAFAAQEGLTRVEATLMSMLVFAGASQFVAAEAWSDSMTLGGIATLGLLTATVNMRFLLMGASLRPWLGGLPAWQTYPALSVMTDPGWIITMRYRAEGGANAACFLGSGLALWLVWIAATVPGHAVDALVRDPNRFGLDLVLPVFFAVMLVPLWRGPRRAVAWAAAGATAVLVSQLGGWWFIVAGAAAGSAVAGLIDGRA